MINLPNIGGLVKVGKNFIMANRPELLFGASITSTLAAVGLAAKGGYDAGVQVERHENVNGVLLDPKEKAKMIWPNFVPAAAATVGALGSTTGLHIVHVKEKKALAMSALAAIDKVKEEAKIWENELIGVADPEKVREIENKVHDKRADENGISRVINGDHEVEELYLVRDGRTGRDKYSNKRQIDEALIELHNVLNESGECDLNYFYNHAGFPNTPDGFKLGWSGVLPSIDWTETVRDDSRPVRVFTFRPEPEKGFERAH